MIVRRIVLPLAGVAVSCALLAGCSTAGEEQVAPVSGSGTAAADATPPAAGAETAEAEAAEATVVTIAVQDGQVVGGASPVDVPVGARVVLQVTSDAADSMHVHGYDLLQDVEAGAPATLEFVARIPGQFDVEFHDARLVLADLRVR